MAGKFVNLCDQQIDFCEKASDKGAFFHYICTINLADKPAQWENFKEYLQNPVFLCYPSVYFVCEIGYNVISFIIL